MLEILVIGASVSEPHTSESNWDFSFSGVRRSVYSQRCNFNATVVGRVRTVSKISYSLVSLTACQPAS